MKRNGFVLIIINLFLMSAFGQDEWITIHSFTKQSNDSVTQLCLDVENAFKEALTKERCYRYRDFNYIYKIVNYQNLSPQEKENLINSLLHYKIDYIIFGEIEDVDKYGTKRIHVDKLLCNNLESKADGSIEFNKSELGSLETFIENRIKPLIKSEICPKDSFTVTYYCHEGDNDCEVPKDSKKYEYGQKVIISDDIKKMKKENYEFVGWNKRKSGKGDTIQAGETIEIEENMELHAMWKQVVFYKNIRFNIESKPKRVKLYIDDSLMNEKSPFTSTLKLENSTPIRLEKEKNYLAINDTVIFTKKHDFKKFYTLEKTRKYKIKQLVRCITFGTFTAAGFATGLYFNSDASKKLDIYNESKSSDVTVHDSNWSSFEDAKKNRNISYVIAGICAPLLTISIFF